MNLRRLARTWVVVACTGVGSGLATAQPEQAEKPMAPADVASIADKLAPSLVKVEYFAQYDKGEAPDNDRWWGGRASFGSFSGASFPQWDGGWAETIAEERPQERGGYLISPTRVFTSDPELHPRFLKSIRVRFGDQVVDARPAAYVRDQSGWFLDLAQPLTNAKPLAFDPSKERPFFGVSYLKRGADWMTTVGSPGRDIVVYDGRKVTVGEQFAVIADKAGTPVTLVGDGDFPVDGSWKVDPAKWNTITADEMGQMLKALDENSSQHVLRVTMNFRSPRSKGEEGGMFGFQGYRRGFDGGDEDESSTEWNGVGFLVDDKTMVVLASLKSKRTARLERIRAFDASGKEMIAKFDGTLKDWGGIVAKFDSPVRGVPRTFKGSITSLRDQLLLRLLVTVRGETRTSYFHHDRIADYSVSYKGRVFPQVAASSGAQRWRGGTSFEHFLYTTGGELVAAPIARRQKVTTQESSYGWRGSEALMTPIAYLLEDLSQGNSAFDADNRPLTEEEENRLAWLGIEMQTMTPELARANDLMDQTNGGQSGGIVTFLYENGPAAKAGIKVGDTLLRLHIEGQPKPLEIVGTDHDMGGMMDQFWSMLDQMPEEYFDQMPRPWGSVETPVTTALTEVGFGTKFKAEVYQNGKTIEVPMEVTQGPAHYDAAPRFKSEGLGMTVRDITYEVRRYFQMKPDEQGVIISKVERGSRSSVAGLKPLETIRSINDKPVVNVKEFEAAVKSGGEFKFAVKRMTQGRTVKVKADAAEGAEGKGGDAGDGAKKE